MLISMKRKSVAFLAAICAICACSVSVFAFTADSSLLSKKVQDHVKRGEITYASVYDIDDVSADALRDAGALAQESGGKVFFNFETLKDDRVIGRITVNPHLVSEESRDYNMMMITDTKSTKAVREHAQKKFKRDKAAVIVTGEEDFGMYVVVSAKLDLSGMDTDNLKVYSYDVKANKYTEIKRANCVVDEQGFLHLQTDRGGCIVIVES